MACTRCQGRPGGCRRCAGEPGSLAEAIRALGDAGMLAPAELETHAEVVSRPVRPESAEFFAQWRRR